MGSKGSFPGKRRSCQNSSCPVVRVRPSPLPGPPAWRGLWNVNHEVGSLAQSKKPGPALAERDARIPRALDLGRRNPLGRLTHQSPLSRQLRAFGSGAQLGFLAAKLGMVGLAPPPLGFHVCGHSLSWGPLGAGFARVPPHSRPARQDRPSQGPSAAAQHPGPRLSLPSRTVLLRL